MAEPKKKKSNSRRKIRRANHSEVVTITKKCSRCGKPTLPHRICSSCNTYNK